MTALLALALIAQTDGQDARKERLEQLLGPAPEALEPVERPDPLRLRDPWLASALGGVAGFGSGHFYAGNATRGFVMSSLDVVLGTGTLWLAFRYRDEVARNDLSLGTQRPRTTREDDLRSGLVALGTGLLLSRVYQAVFSYRDAVDTNARLESYSFVPLPDPEP